MSDARDPVVETEPEETLADASDDEADEELLAEADPDDDDIELDADAEDGDSAEDELDLADDEPAKPERPLTRGERRFHAMSAENNRLKATIAEMLAQAGPQPQNRANHSGRAAEKVQIEREIADLSAMPEADQNAYWARRHAELLEQRLMRHQLELDDKLDRISFENLVREKKYPRGTVALVEAALANARSQNMNPSRQEILAWRLGLDAIENRERDIARARARVASQTVRPSPDYSSTAGGGPNRRRQDDDLDERLRRTPLKDLK